MTTDTTDWKELREFKDVDITKSYVLSWGTESETLLIDVDLYLCRGHPLYEKPRPAEKACFRPAYLEFRYCCRVAPVGDRRARGMAEVLDTLGIGKIDGFRRTGEGQYEIRGEFGAVDITAERPMVRLKSNYLG
jgi:hypothetical protein